MTQKKTQKKYMLFYCKDKDFYSFYRESRAGSGMTILNTYETYEVFLDKLKKDTQKFSYVEFDGGLLENRQFDANVEPLPSSLVKKIIEELKEKGIKNIIQ
jgi:hypothetical protein